MKIRWLTFVLSVLTFILVLFVSPIILAHQKILSVSEFLEILSVVISWPFAILVISLIFFTRFHGAIDSFLRNTGSMKFPGGFEIQRQSPTSSVDETASRTEGLLILSDQEKISKIDKDLSESQTKKNVEELSIELLKQQYSQLVVNARFWKFSYLNQFFVIQTKNVLSWFSKSGPVTRQSYDTLWLPYIPDQNQRNIILSVLLQNGMLTDSDGTIRISEEGYAFLQFIGYVPPAPV